MSKPLAPEIENYLHDTFQFPQKLLIGQLASSSSDGPWQRTLRIYGIEEKLGLIFLTHTGSRKWRELSQERTFSLCLLDPTYKVQLNARCKAQLLTRDHDLKLFEKYWFMIREDVRRTYLSEGESTDKPSVNLGMIAGFPDYWESLCLEDDYAQSKRNSFKRTAGGTWSKIPLPLHS